MIGVWVGAAAVVGWIVTVTVDFLVSVTGTISMTLVVAVAYCGMIYMSIGVSERWQRDVVLPRSW